MNEEYSHDISVKTRSALDIKRRNGDFVGAFTVYGYLKTGESHKSLVIDPFAANVVRDIFRKRMEGYSANSIATELNDRGILSPLAYKRSQGLPYAKGGYADREDCKWSATTVIRILQDEIYTGTMVQGKQKTPHFKLKELETKSPEEWVRVEGTHEAIIDKADFDLVQKLRRLDTRTAPHLEKVHLFSGVLVCGCCGSRMTRKTNHYKGKEYHYYYCPSGKKGGCQSSSMIKESDLIECVQTSLKNHIDSIVTLNSFITSVSQERINRELVQEYTQYIQANERQLEQVESFKRKLYESLVNGLISKEEFLQYKQDYNAKADKIKASITSLNEKMNDVLENRSDRNRWINHFLEFSSMQEIDRNAVVRLIHCIRITGKKELEITFNYFDEYRKAVNMVEQMTTERRVG